MHLSYEMVALSPAAAEELGFELSDEDRQRPFIEMSGRKGLGVKADDLINRLEENALREVEGRHADLSIEEKQQTAHIIAVGALRYFLLKFTRNTIIIFDFKEALAFEGETGTYCQNATVRLNSIFRKLGDAKKMEADNLIKSAINTAAIVEILNGDIGNELWSLVTLGARLEEIIALSAQQNEPAHLAKYTFTLAKASNLFYQKHRIISEENAVKRAVLVTVADITRRQLTTALRTLGIVVPERM